MAKKRANGEGSISQRKDGRWEQQLMIGYDSNGKRIRKSFYGKTQKEVRDKVELFKQNMKMGLTSDPDILFTEWADRWYLGHKNKVEGPTYVTYGYSLAILKKYFGRKKLREIKALDIEGLIEHMREDGKSDAYIAKARSVMFQIMHKAEANDLILKNPVRFVDKMKKVKKSKPREPFTLQEVAILMKHLPDDRAGHSIRLMIASGLRRQEMVALQPEHIAEDGSVIYVQQAIKKEGNKEWVGDPKSFDSKRKIPIPVPVRPSAVFLRQQAEEYIWTAQNGKPFRMRTFSDHYMRALEKVEGVRKLTPHCCRHTYVTYLQSLGVDIETIRAIAGHADVDMTSQYIHVQDETKQKAVDLLGEALA